MRTFWKRLTKYKLLIKAVDDVKKTLASIGAEIDNDKLNNVVNSLKGKNLSDVYII